jgi:hypothetical protein
LRERGPRRGALAATVAALLLLPAWAVAAQGTCGGLDPPTPSVGVDVADPPEPRIVAAAEAEIRRRAGAAGKSTRGDAITRGLTVSETATEAGYTLAKATLPDGTGCVALKGIEARVADRGVTLLVDRSYRPGSCEYRAILDHEQEHVRINAEALRQTGRLLEEQLEAVAGRWGGRWSAPEQAPRIDEAVGRAVREATAAARGEAEARHRRLDTPESYAEAQERCGNW